MNPPKFYGSKVDEDPQDFIDEVHKIVAIMEAPPEKKAEFMTHVEQIEEKNLKEVARMTKKARIEDGSSFDNSSVPKYHKDRVPNPRYQGDNDSGQAFLACQKCGKYHPGDCLASSGVCFGYGVKDHKLRHFSWVAKNDTDSH
ncbi:uncharacterized protein LOC129890597 [Solanum dulcamara]|uniref:uncharacterized protein LOC129890597 n=1 Tax=Solanum dulcamara TaxID=45834 RepID=UPI0024852F42|nr:uncharacterized protein LOC129890597 [Solanum dulcamara]